MKTLSILLLLFVVALLFFVFSTKNEEAKDSIAEVVNPTSPPTIVDTADVESIPNESLMPKQEKGMSPRTEPKRKSASSVIKKTLPKVDNVTSVEWLVDTPWKLWIGVTAINKNQARNLDTKVMGEVNGFLLVENKNEKESGLFSSAAPFVVVDQRLNSFGVISGVFSVTLKEGQSGDFLLQNSDLRVRESFPEIRTYYITAAEEPFDLELFRKFLLKMPGVESVKIEVLSRQYEKY